MDAFAKSMDTFFVDCNRNVRDDVKTFVDRHMTDASYQKTHKKGGTSPVYTVIEPSASQEEGGFFAKNIELLCYIILVYNVVILPIHSWVGGSADRGKYIFFTIFDAIFVCLLLVFTYFARSKLKNKGFLLFGAFFICVVSLMINILHNIKDDSESGHQSFLVVFSFLIIGMIYEICIFWFVIHDQDFNDFKNSLFTVISILIVVVGAVLANIKMKAKKEWLGLIIPIICINVAWFVFWKMLMSSED